MKGLLRFSCLILVLAAVLRCESGGINPLESPEILMGTIQGMVSAGGEPISGAAVSFGGPGFVRTTMSGLDGTFRFDDVPPGVYTVTAVLVGHACESVIVEVDQTAIAGIVCQPVGRLVGSIRLLDGSLISGAQVAVSGPVSRETTTGSGAFVFVELPPGDYTVSATGGGVCPSVTATVQVAQITSVEIVCELFGGREVEGNWFMSLPREDDDLGGVLYSQVGDCPPPLPPDNVITSIAFDSASGTISIEGLDPDVALAGILYDGGCEDCVSQPTRGFSGSGSALRADGSSIRSELTGSFVWSPSGRGYFFFGRLTRAHRDPGDNLICTEAYAVRGNKQ